MPPSPREASCAPDTLRCGWAHRSQWRASPLCTLDKTGGPRIRLVTRVGTDLNDRACWSETGTETREYRLAPPGRSSSPSAWPQVITTPPSRKPASDSVTQIGHLVLALARNAIP